MSPTNQVAFFSVRAKWQIRQVENRLRLVLALPLKSYVIHRNKQLSERPKHIKNKMRPIKTGLHVRLITLWLISYFSFHACSTWLYDVCRGREYEPVRPRQLSKSCGCGKNFPGKSKLISKQKVRYWIFQFASELSDRLKTEQEKV